MEETTLMFRHLPAELSKEEKKDFLFNFGASRVHVMGTSGRMKNTAFGVFPSKDHATEVLHQLHQADLLGSTLVVEIARCNDAAIPSVLDGDVKISSASNTTGDGKVGGQSDSEKKNVKTEAREIKFDETFGIWGLKHPRRPELRYHYPPPSPSIVANIMNALVALPKFYVQVLHLMNKMDLPAPFGAVTPAPPMVPSYVMPDDVDQREMEISSGDDEIESEMESDGEGKESHNRSQESKDLAEKALRRRRKHLKNLVRTKRPRLSEFQQRDNSISENATSAANNLPISDVFEQMPDSSSTAASTTKKMAVNFKLPTIESTDGRKLSSSSFNFDGGERNWQQHPQKPPQQQQQHTQQLPTFSSSLSVPSTTGLEVSLDSTQPLSHHQHLQPRQQQQQQQHHHHPNHPVPQHPHHHHQHPPPPPPTQDTNPETRRAGGHHHHHPHAVPEDRGTTQETVTQPVLYSPTMHEDDGDEGSNTVEGESGQTSSSGFGTIQHNVKQGLEDTQNPDTDGREEKDVASSAARGAVGKDTKFISSSALRRGRLTKEEMQESSVFRRYDPGEASCRLYIKNVARQASEADLRHIYGRYVDWESDTDVIMFDVRLMKEGRMKGQAFVTLPSQEVAKDALSDTNGFVLKDKALVVQFARSAKAQEDAAAVKS